MLCVRAICGPKPPSVCKAAVVSFDISNNREQDRYEIRRDGEMLGLAEYQLTPRVIAFTHTETDPQHKGQGVASALIAFALKDAEAHGLAVLPLCPFVQAAIAKHPETYLHLVPEGVRAHFDLPDSAS